MASACDRTTRKSSAPRSRLPDHPGPGESLSGLREGVRRALSGTPLVDHCEDGEFVAARSDLPLDPEDLQFFFLGTQDERVSYSKRAWNISLRSNRFAGLASSSIDAPTFLAIPLWCASRSRAAAPWPCAERPYTSTHRIGERRTPLNRAYRGQQTQARTSAHPGEHADGLGHVLGPLDRHAQRDHGVDLVAPAELVEAAIPGPLAWRSRSRRDDQARNRRRRVVARGHAGQREEALLCTVRCEVHWLLPPPHPAPARRTTRPRPKSQSPASIRAG